MYTNRISSNVVVQVPTEPERAAMLECLAREYQLDIQGTRQCHLFFILKYVF